MTNAEPFLLTKEEFIRGWYKTMTGEKIDSDGFDFETRYKRFMGDIDERGGFQKGHNRQLLKEFIAADDDKLLSIYLLLIYHHTEEGKRLFASAQSWRRATFLSLTIAIISVSLALLNGAVEFLPWVFAFLALSLTGLLFGGFIVKLKMEQG